MEKLNRLIRPGCYHPLFKNGAALGAILGIATVGAVSGAGAAAGDALADSLFDTSGRDFAAGQNEQNRQWQSEEAQKNRDFQQQMQESNSNWYTNQWMMQNAQTNKQWYQQADYSNNLAYQSWWKQQQYNTPAAIASRLQSAGANPSAVLNAQTFGGTGLSPAPVSPNSPNVSLPSTPSGAMPSSAMSSAAQLPITSHSVSELAAAYKSFKEGSVEKEKANAIITNLLADTKNKETINRMNEIDLAIKKSGMSAKQQQAAMQPFLEVRKLIADIQVSKALGGVYNEDAALKKLQSIYQDAQNTMVGKKLARYDEILSNEILLGAEEIKTEKSKQASNYASAYQNTEAAKLHIEQQEFTKMETDLSALKKVAQVLQNGIDANKFKSSELSLEREQADQLFNLIEKADKLDDIRNDWNLWNQVRRIKNLLGMQTSASVSVHN